MNLHFEFVMRYSSDFIVTDLILIPKFFFVPQIIEKRKPLALTARRAEMKNFPQFYLTTPAAGDRL